MSQFRWVHCHSHGAPHVVKEDDTCWCALITDGDPGSSRQATLLDQTGNTHADHVAAAQECRDKGLWLYGDKYA